MNDTTLREMQLRDLTFRLARAQTSTAQLAAERDSAIRQFGLGHPRSIDVSRRLMSAQSAHRRLSEIRRLRAGDLARNSKRQGR